MTPALAATLAAALTTTLAAALATGLATGFGDLRQRLIAVSRCAGGAAHQGQQHAKQPGGAEHKLAEP